MAIDLTIIKNTIGINPSFKSCGITFQKINNPTETGISKATYQLTQRFVLFLNNPKETKKCVGNAHIKLKLLAAAL